jgi:hypothetical protein
MSEGTRLLFVNDEPDFPDELRRVPHYQRRKLQMSFVQAAGGK